MRANRANRQNAKIRAAVRAPDCLPHPAQRFLGIATTHGAVMVLLVFSVFFADRQATGESPGTWIGCRLPPAQCLKIEKGIFRQKGKTHDVVYDIETVYGVYQVQGTLLLDERFDASDAKRICLDVLLMGENHVCKKQIHLCKTLEENWVAFSFVTEKRSDFGSVHTTYRLEYHPVQSNRKADRDP